MMLVSKDLKKCLALMTLGATVLTGCASGPGTGFTRFWPKKNNDAAVEQDEALAAKWRARIRGTDDSEEKIVSEQEVVVGSADTETPQKSRFGFLKFPWSRDKKTEEVEIDEYQKLEERLAQLEAEKRSLMQAQGKNSGSVELTRRGSKEDPFLKAEQQNRSANAFDAYARTNSPSESKVATPPATGLPKWAQNTAPTEPQPERRVIIGSKLPAANNEFAPDFDQSLKNLGTEIEREAAAQPAATAQVPSTSAAPFPGEEPNAKVAGTAPALPELNVAPEAPKVAMTEAPAVAKSQPMLDRPIVDEQAEQHPLANLKTVDEQRDAWATLEVQQLMKHARIQARANQFEDAMKTVLAAEQLANNANLKFPANEQTPAELIMVLRYHIEQQEFDALASTKQPPNTAPAGIAQVTAAPQAGTESNLPAWPHGITVQPKVSREVASTQPAKVTTPARPAVEEPIVEAPANHLPQWPAQTVALETSNEPKGRYIEARPGYTNPARTQLITSSSIYSSENLRWAKLESERATLKESNDQQIAAEDLELGGIPPGPVDQDDPFAAAFGSSDAEEEALIEELPDALIAPEIPAEGEPMMSVWDDELFGVPVRRLGLLLLAGLILLAAIIHRRRNNLEQV